jgi:hypothetical protein
MGYSTYLTFLLGYVTTLVTVYFLAIKNIPELLIIFPQFGPFSVLATIIGAPLSIIIGWLHLKRSGAFAAETDIGAEANPYYYKLYPGYVKEVQYPVYLELLLQMKRLMDTQRTLTAEDKERIDSLEKKLRTLIEGGYVGTPRRRDLRPTK